MEGDYIENPNDPSAAVKDALMKVMYTEKMKTS
jgi:hypothetical protein